MSVKKSNLFFFIIFFISFFPIFAKPNQNKPQYISVEKILAKDKPSFWSSGDNAFYYGDVVFIMEEKGSWLKVRNESASKSGWVKESVITSRKIVGKNRISVDAKEIALAGKGFSSSLEEEYSNYYSIDFDIVDEVEKINITEEEIKDFIMEGSLKGGDE